MTEPPRRSSRLKTRTPFAFKELDPVSDHEEGYHTSEDYSGDDARPAKKRKRTSIKRGEPTRQKRRGKLARLPDMPLDILCEIFGHLRPLDLLYLAWTTKALRGVLMSRSSRFIWKQAIAASDGLPPSPPDLTEPQYTRLAFHHYCHFCQAPSIANVFWTARVRSCKKCVNEHFVIGHGTELLPGPLRDAMKIAGYSNMSQFINHIMASGMRRYDYYYPRLLKTQVQKFSDDAMPLINDREKFHTFLQERKKLTAAVEEHAAKCETWYNGQRSYRRGELQDVRIFRRSAIEKKLAELGWGTELEELSKFEPYAFNSHSLVRQPRELTDRIWTNIKPQLVKWLETKKEERLERERIRRVVSRLSILKEVYNDYYIQHIGEIVPTIADFYNMPDVYDILNSDADVTVTKETFAPILAKLPDLIENWRTDNLEKLSRLVPAEVTPPTQTKKGKEKESHSSMLSALSLATCLFKCPNCAEPLSRERIFHHHCLTSSSTICQIGYDYKDPEKDVYSGLRYLPLHYKRPFGGLEYSEDFAQSAVGFIQMNGLDPKLATGEEMDAIDARFFCHHCSRGDERKVMSWRFAIAHQREHHKSHLRWSKLDGIDEDRARKIEDDFVDRSPVLSCICCITKNSSSEHLNKPGMREHLITKHGIQDADAKEGEHYYRDPEYLGFYFRKPIILPVLKT